ncbi:hypothetical protein JTB14_030626 [Gonioctena quinquepunctata]|nr:hypothetical protein JTB14_030626 [Gonioctena quinquepunctata]
MDKNSRIIPTPKNLMECQSDSVGKCMNSDKIKSKFDTLFEQAENYEKTNMDKIRKEDEVEYLEINQAVKKVLWYRTRMAKHHQQKSKALAGILAKSITEAVARSMKYRMPMKTTLNSQYEFKYKGTQSAIEKLIPISEEMSKIER